MTRAAGPFSALGDYQSTGLSISASPMFRFLDMPARCTFHYWSKEAEFELLSLSPPV